MVSDPVDQLTVEQIDALAKKERAWTRGKVLRLFIGLLLLACLFAYVPFSAVLENLRGVSIPLFAVSCAIILASEFLASIHLRILADTHKLEFSTKQVFETILATRFYGLIMPGGNVATMLVRVYRLAGVRGHFAGSALAATSDRLVATLTLCMVGCLFWVLAMPANALLWLLLDLAALVAIAFLVATFLTRRPWPLRRYLLPLAERLIGKNFDIIRRAFADSRALPHRRLLHVFALSFAAHLLGIFAFYVLALALGLQIDFLAIGWVRSAIVLASLIPISLLGLGLREGAAILALPTYGISADAAMAFSLGVFATTVLFLGLLGGIMEARRHFIPHQND
ncbi:MAG: flippase-like domain-containing protein [Rhodospirillales bacterium]|nr:flippase-like domain-containing protein [Rhodospirillales bacterium]